MAWSGCLPGRCLGWSGPPGVAAGWPGVGCSSGDQQRRGRRGLVVGRVDGWGPGVAFPLVPAVVVCRGCGADWGGQRLDGSRARGRRGAVRDATAGYVDTRSPARGVPGHGTSRQRRQRRRWRLQANSAGCCQRSCRGRRGQVLRRSRSDGDDGGSVCRADGVVDAGRRRRRHSQRGRCIYAAQAQGRGRGGTGRRGRRAPTSGCRGGVVVGGVWVVDRVDLGYRGRDEGRRLARDASPFHKAGDGGRVCAARRAVVVGGGLVVWWVGGDGGPGGDGGRVGWFRVDVHGFTDRVAVRRVGGRRQRPLQAAGSWTTSPKPNRTTHTVRARWCKTATRWGRGRRWR